MSDARLPAGRSTAPAANPYTTLLASGWGLLASYQLLVALLVTHSARFLIVAPMSLLMVWAALERKRWGRMALLGMSLTVLLSCLVGGGAAYAARAEAAPAVLALCADSTSAAVMTLVLAIWTSVWMCLPRVVWEFEQGKRTGLRMGQRVIAVGLVACWGAFLLFPVTAAGHQRHVAQGVSSRSASGCSLHSGPHATVNNRIVRSAAPHRSR